MTPLQSLIDEMGFPWQQQTADLAILATFDDGVKLVRILWPSVDGRRLRSDEIEDWLKQRRLVWRCLCPSHGGGSRATAVFEVNTNGDMSVMCPNGFEGCGFQVDLDRVRHSSELPCSDYAHFEPGQTGGEFEKAIGQYGGMETSDDDYLHAGMKLYNGYCGDYEEL